MRDATRILTRHPDNPLIRVADCPGAMQVFNPSPAVYQGETILLLSMIFFAAERGGETRVARSRDGIHFAIDDHAFICLPTEVPPWDRINSHVIDSRVTKIGDTYYLLTPIIGPAGPVAVLGMTKDFVEYEVIEVVTQPMNRGASLFPEKIGGKYYKLDRPGAGDNARAGIWLSSSPDLIHWGCFRPLLNPGYVLWGEQKIGPTPPIKTEAGWLVIVHGVYRPCDGPHYCIGAILLDHEDPTQVIGKTMSYLLAPDEDYETRGRVDNVVFPCGALADPEKDELRLYYGAADTSICLATGSLLAVLEACQKQI